LQEALLPSGQTIEALLIGNVKYESTAICASVESVAEGLELFLACGVPDLEINLLIVNHDLLLLEICTNSRLGHARLLIHVLLEQGGLAHARVTQDHDL
jgi:hypothetical protein